MDGEVNGDFFLHSWSTEKKRKVLERVLRAKEDDGDERYADDDSSEGRSLNEDCRLLWEVFNAKQHVGEVKSHKEFLFKCYHRFKDCFPNLEGDQVERHDDSKLSFVEVVGYTDRFVWQRVNSKCWNLALRHHYDNNSHHPEFYMKVDAGGYPTQRDMAPKDLEESIVDMLACQWERSFGGNKDVNSSELATVSDVYLDRYTPGDKILVKKYLKTVSESLQ